jgi:hypothetical protein
MQWSEAGRTPRLGGEALSFLGGLAGWGRLYWEGIMPGGVVQ